MTRFCSRPQKLMGLGTQPAASIVHHSMLRLCQQQLWLKFQAAKLQIDLLKHAELTAALLMLHSTPRAPSTRGHLA